MATSFDKNKDDFLRFSAYSFKELITRKLTEDSKFTDQVYEGSNIAILIDLCAYLFQGLTYCINNAAAESMFSDTLIYKNISRLVKLIGYNPKGFIPSSCQFSFDSPYNDIVVPRYTAVDTGKNDSLGNKIYYSFVEDFTVAKGVNEVKLINGKWSLYHTIFTAAGTKYETFVLDDIVSDTSKDKFDAYGYIDVYVNRNDKFIKFQGLTDEIFLNITSKYSGENDAITIYRNSDQDLYYSIRLNEDKKYEIKFGNDNNGLKLMKGDKLYIFYMKSNGFDAKLTIGEVINARLIEPSRLLGIDQDKFYKGIIASSDDSIDMTDVTKDNIVNFMNEVTNCINTTESTVAYSEETVEEIKEIAPDFYKLGNRLVSKSDFEYYVKNRYRGDIIDVKCLNNWDYISSFYGWLYNLGKNGVRTEYSTSKVDKRASNPIHYIDKKTLVKWDYFYADPADLNNVYLWVKMQNNLLNWKTTLDQSLNSIKLLTAEMVFVDPIIVNFSICAAPVQRVLEYLDSDILFDESKESYLEVTINDNSLYSNASVKLQINAIFAKKFRQLDLKLGQVVSSNDIEQEIYGLPGVERIRTVFSSNAVDENGQKRFTDRFIDGISFASWSSNVIDVGDDLVVSTVNRKLEDFLFPNFYDNYIVDKIVVIKRSFSNNSTVQY